MSNYKNAVIYKLCCKDASITDEYIGSTCNKYKRKYDHKIKCGNINDIHYNTPVYQFIRVNGNFENWDMIILEEYPCENKVQLHQKERYWIEERKPTLNSYSPIRTQEEKKEFRIEYDKDYSKKRNKTDKYKEYQKQYELTENRKEYKKQYGIKYRQQKKLKNQSAIIIQRFFKKYLGL